MTPPGEATVGPCRLPAGMVGTVPHFWARPCHDPFSRLGSLAAPPLEVGAGSRSLGFPARSQPHSGAWWWQRAQVAVGASRAGRGASSARESADHGQCAALPLFSWLGTLRCHFTSLGFGLPVTGYICASPVRMLESFNNTETRAQQVLGKRERPSPSLSRRAAASVLE